MVLAAERAAREKAVESYRIGSQKRMEEIAAFEKLYQDTIVTIGQKETMLATAEQDLAVVEEELASMKRAYKEVLRMAVTTVTSDLSSYLAGATGPEGMLDELTIGELKSFIIQVCQLEGELAEEGDHSNDTCVPLRLAGIEGGVVWENENLGSLLAFANTGFDSDILADLVWQNAHGARVWSRTDANVKNDRSAHRRRLEDDYDYDDDDEEDYHSYDDDYVDDEYGGAPSRSYKNSNTDSGDSMSRGESFTDLRKDLEVSILSSVLSAPRKSFLDRSKVLVEMIDEAQRAIDEADDEDEDGGDDDENAQFDNAETADNDQAAPKSTPAGSVKDPMALKMVRSQLTRIRTRIHKGLDYAVSAHTLLESLSTNGSQDDAKQHADLLVLATMTLLHSQVSAQGGWLVLNSALPEFTPTEGSSSAAASSNDDQTCASPFAVVCPPKTIVRNGKTLPPAGLISAGEMVCAKAVETANTAAASCLGTDGGVEIPDNITDGMYGYTSSQARDDTDIFSMWEQDRLDGAVAPASTTEVEDKITDLEHLVKSVGDEIQSLTDSVGGRPDNDSTDNNYTNSAEFIAKAELHAIKDTCFEVEAGKYVYETCVNGRAQQKDKGQSHGTSLGNWEGMETNDDGIRIMSWKNGQKCWNGPHRSATVIVACGAETKLLSAEEPDTCRYLMEMESPMGCDERYYADNNLGG